MGQINLHSNGIYDTAYSNNHPVPTSMPLMMSPSGSAITPFSGAWTKPYGTYAYEHTVSTGTAYASRSAADQAILTAMNRQMMHFQPSFQVWRLTMPSGRESSYCGAYHMVRHNYGSMYTTGAFIKLISGNVMTGNWCNGYDSSAGGWQLCGAHYGASGSGYTHNHPYGASGDSACVMLVALPMTVWGKINLDHVLNWWPFPSNASNSGSG
jgi:hypothetical protein